MYSSRKSMDGYIRNDMLSVWPKADTVKPIKAIRTYSSKVL